MKQYRVTTDNIIQDSPNDCYLDPLDPVHEIKVLQHLGGINAQARLHEYRVNQGSNISVTGDDKGRIQREQNIKPGTPEWFKLWFSLPYMTGEKPTENKDENR